MSSTCRKQRNWSNHYSEWCSENFDFRFHKLADDEMTNVTHESGPVPDSPFRPYDPQLLHSKDLGCPSYASDLAVCNFKDLANVSASHFVKRRDVGGKADIHG
jgi:hypothetical protein